MSAVSVSRTITHDVPANPGPACSDLSAATHIMSFTWRKLFVKKKYIYIFLLLIIRICVLHLLSNTQQYLHSIASLITHCIPCTHTYPQIHHHGDWTAGCTETDSSCTLKDKLCDLQKCLSSVTSSPSHSLTQLFREWEDASDPV